MLYRRTAVFVIVTLCFTAPNAEATSGWADATRNLGDGYFLITVEPRTKLVKKGDSGEETLFEFQRPDVTHYSVDGEIVFFRFQEPQHEGWQYYILDKKSGRLDGPMPETAFFRHSEVTKRSGFEWKLAEATRAERSRKETILSAIILGFIAAPFLAVIALVLLLLLVWRYVARRKRRSAIDG